MKFKNFIQMLIAVISIVIVNSCKNDKAPEPDAGRYFPKVKAIIQSKCLSCHSSAGTFSGQPIAFDTDAEIAAGYASIKASVADSVTFSNKRMPQGDSLSAGDIEIIVKWFDKGGKITD